MDLAGWNMTDFNQVYKELLVNFVEKYRPHAPPKPAEKTVFNQHLTVNPAMDEDIFAQLLATATGPQLKQTDQPGAAGNEMTEADRDFMMRYLQLKYSILFLQKQKFIGKYCFYGCWCLPNGAGDLGAGTGPPVDNIDKASVNFLSFNDSFYFESSPFGAASNIFRVLQA